MKTLVISLLLLPLAAQATVVTTLTDEDNDSHGGGAGISLREAVKYSSGGTTVTFAHALSGQTILLTLGPLQRFSSLTIDASALPAGLTLSADKTGNGKTPNDTSIFLFGVGDLILKSLTLSGSSVGESSGCIKIYDKQQVHLTLDSCTLRGNSGYHAGAIYARAFRPNSSINIRNSTFSGNSAAKGGAAIESHGFALTIENSTFSENSGGTINFSDGSLTLDHVTITGGTPSAASFSNYPGIHVDLATTQPINIQNTICAGNTPQNLNAFAFTGSNNLLSGDPELAPLGNYGGPTQTMPPTQKSPAINAGSVTAITTDQRGSTRVGLPDIGAAEYQGYETETALRWNVDSDGDGSPYGIERALGTNDEVADSSCTRNLTAPTFKPSGHPVLRFGIGTSNSDIRWILKCSTDLRNFQEIYRYGGFGSADTAAPGVTFLRSNTNVSVTDTTPPLGGAYYRFEAVFEP